MISLSVKKKKLPIFGEKPRLISYRINSSNSPGPTLESHGPREERQISGGLLGAAAQGQLLGLPSARAELQRREQSLDERLAG